MSFVCAFMYANADLVSFIEMEGKICQKYMANVSGEHLQLN